jgi:hypothetical protein
MPLIEIRAIIEEPRMLKWAGRELDGRRILDDVHQCDLL